MRCRCSARFAGTGRDAQVDWLVEEAYAPILELVSGLRPAHHRPRATGGARPGHRTEGSQPGSETVSFGGTLGYPRAVAFLRRQQYDVALDLQGLIKSAVWARLSGARRVVGFHRDHVRETQAAALYTDEVVPPPSAHVIQKNLALAVGARSVGADARVSAATERGTADARRDCASRRRRTLHRDQSRSGVAQQALACRSIWRAGWRRSPSRHGLGSIVTWGPSEHELAESVVRSSGGAAHLAPPTSIADLAVSFETPRSSSQATPARCTSPRRWARRWWVSMDRPGPNATGPGIRPTR